MPKGSFSLPLAPPPPPAGESNMLRNSLDKPSLSGNFGKVECNAPDKRNSSGKKLLLSGE